jgi:hypothetical protein
MQQVQQVQQTPQRSVPPGVLCTPPALPRKEAQEGSDNAWNCFVKNG